MSGTVDESIGAIREGSVGDVVEVLSTDAGSFTDIPAWVAKASHEMVAMTQKDDATRFVIRKTR